MKKKVIISVLFIIVVTVLISGAIYFYKNTIDTKYSKDKIVELVKNPNLKSTNYRCTVKNYVSEAKTLSSIEIFNHYTNSLTYSKIALPDENTITHETITSLDTNEAILIDHNEKEITKQALDVYNAFTYNTNTFLEKAKNETVNRNVFKYKNKATIEDKKCLVVTITDDFSPYKYIYHYYIEENTGLILKSDCYTNVNHDKYTLKESATYSYEFDVVKEEDIIVFDEKNYKEYDIDTQYEKD